MYVCFDIKIKYKMQLKIHKEGWVYFIISLIISIVTFPIFKFIGLILFIFSFYVYYFFRDPKRSIPIDDFILSPADGIVTFIGKSKLPINYDTNDDFIKVSIFLNIFNVHVNRLPANGVIKVIKYIKGKFINATFDKSSRDNERNIILIEKNNKDIIVVTQIAGLIARRIICEVKENQISQQGHRFGIIKFGSRVDIYLPSKYKLLISMGQIMVGGETIISNPNNITQITENIKN